MWKLLRQNIKKLLNYIDIRRMDCNGLTNDVYIYIDESGTLTKNDGFFILSCFITDSIATIKEQLSKLKEDILSNPYFYAYRGPFLRQGFHACDNHPDIRSQYYALLPKLNIRIYSLVINKSSNCFSDIYRKCASDDELYAFFVKKLLTDRIKSEYMKQIHIIFEEYGNSITKHKANMRNVVFNISQCVSNKRRHNINIDVDIHKKDDIALSVVDYTNYILYQILSNNNSPRMMDNFNLIKPKIALVYSLHNKKFYDRRKSINFAEIKQAGRR